MEDNKFMVGAPKMNAMTYGSMDTVQNIPTTSERKQQVQEYDYDIPSNLADIYTRKGSTETPEEKSNDYNWSKILNVATGIAFTPNAGIAIKGGYDIYNSQLGQSVVEKAVETNIRSLEGDLARKELRTMQSIEFLKDYEEKLQRLNQIQSTGEGDPQEATQLQTYLDQNAQTYELLIRGNSKLAPLYYDGFETNSITGEKTTSIGLQVDPKKVPLWDRLMLSISTMFDNKAEAYEEYVKTGYGDAVLNIKPKESVWNNPDRTGIINSLQKLYDDSITSQELKVQKIKDRQGILKEGSWFFDPNQISPEFRERVNNNEFAWGDLESYPYAIPQLGSSLGEIASTVETATLGRLVSMAAKTAAKRGNPYSAALLAIGEFGLNAANSYYQRTQETNAEVFDAYLNNIVNQMDSGNLDVDRILDQGIEKLQARGINTDEMTMPQILEDMLLYNIKTDDPNFENIKLSAYNGLDNIFTSNMALGVWDAMDMALYSYGGKLAVKSAKELLKQGGKGLAKVTGLTKVANIADKFIDNRINKALYRMASKDVFKANKYRDVLNTVVGLGTKLGVTAFGEGTEEGQQYLIQRDYELSSKYDPKKMTLLDAFFKNFQYGAEANMALMGLHPDEALNNDKELEQNMKVGALIGLLMGGAGTTISDGHQLIRDVKSNKMLRNMAAYDISNKEEDVKVDRWYNAVKKGYTQDVIQNLQDIRDRFTPEGLTQEDIDEDIKKARQLESIYYNPNVSENLEQLGIKVGSEEHKTFAKNAMKAYDLERVFNSQAKEANKKLTEKVNQIYSSDEFRNSVDEYWDNLSDAEREAWGVKENLVSTVRDAQQAFTTLNVLNKLKRQLKDMQSFIAQAKKNGLDVSDENIASVVYHINRKQKQLEDATKKDKQMFKQLKDIFGINTDPELEQLIADESILVGLLSKAVNRRAAYQNGVVLRTDMNRRADFNIRNWPQLSEQEQQEVRDRYTKEAQDNGQEAPSDRSIIARYNRDVQQNDIIDESVNAARKYANDIIKADLDRYTQNDRSYSEVSEIEDAQNEDTQDTQMTSEEEPDFTPTGEGDNSGSQIASTDLDVKQREEETSLVEDVYTESEEDKLTAKDEETGDIEEMDISDLVTVADDAEDVSNERTVDDITEEEITRDTKDDTQDKIDMENLMDASNFRDPDDDFGLTSDDNPFLDPQTEPEIPDAIKATMIEDQPEELPFIDPVALERSANKAFPDAEDYFIDNQGRMFLNGKEVTKEQIEKENLAEQYSDDSTKTLSEKANEQEKEKGIVPGLSSSTSIMNSWLVGRTLFYRPDATKPMDLPFKVKGAKNIHSGKELGEAMGDPNFLSDAKVYFVPGPTMSSNEAAFDPNDPTTYRNAAVYMIIDKNGEIYAAAYRSNAKAAIDYQHRLGSVPKESKAAEDLNTLAAQKEKIVSFYLEKCKKDKNGKYVLPEEGLTHVVPTQVNVSNGTFNNQKDGNKPIFRKLSECKTFQIPLDPNKILTECTFGYGVGGIQVGYKADPFAIKQLGTDEVLASSGGFAGKMAIFPKPSATPRGRYTVPVYLSEKFFRDESIKKPSDIKLRSHDEAGNPTPNGSYSNFMEYVLDLITDGDPYGVLPLIVNQGEKTRLSAKKQEEVQFLAKKQLGFDPETELFYFASPRSDRNGLYFRTDVPLSEVKTNPIARKAILWYMMQNYHWNMDKNVLSQSLPERLRDLAIRVLEPGDEKLVLYPGELEFTLAELGISEKEGKLVKDKVAPPAIAWAVNSGKLLTDMGDYAFRDGFIYAEDITVNEAQTPVSVSTEPISVAQPVETKPEPVKEPEVQPEKPVEEKVEEQPKVKPTSENRQSRRAKAQELVKSLNQPDASAPKVARYMTSEEREQFAASLGQKVSKENFVYLYDLDGKPQMFIKSMLEKVFKEVGLEPTFYVTGMYSTEENEVNRISQDLREAKSWLMDKLGLSVDQVMVFNGVMRSASNGPRVYGVTRLAANGIGNIILGQGAGKGIQYHEAWHYINLLVHSPRERQIVYDDYVKHHPEYKNASINEVEEAMAEDFRSWAIVQNAKWYNLGYQTIKLFRAIKDFVKSMFNISDSLYTTIYKGINKGRYSQYELNSVSMEEFHKAFTDNGTFFSIPGVPQDRLKNMPSIINPDVFYNVLDSLTSTLLSVFNVRQASDISKLTENLDYIPSIIEGNMMAGLTPEENEQLIEEVLDNWDIFRKEMAEQLSTLNIKAEEVEVDKNGDVDGKNNDERYDRVAFEFSKKLNMSFNAKLFFYSIPKMEYDKNKELVPVVDPIFGLNMTESFDVSWNKIMENLWDIERWEDLESRCLRLGNADPFFKSLYNYISGDNKPDENTCTQILTTIKSAKNEMTSIEFKEAFEKANSRIQDEDLVLDVKTSMRAKAGKWRILDSSLLRLQNKYPRQWGKLFYVSGMIDKSNPNKFEIDQDKLEDLNVDFMLIKEKIDEIAAPFTSKRPKAITFTEDDIRKASVTAKEELVNWLNGIGIDVDIKSIDYLLYGIKSMNPKLPTIEGFDKMYTLLNDSSKGNIRNQILGNLDALSKGETKLLKLNNPFPVTEDSFIQKLAIAHGKSHPNPSEFSVTGPNNTTVYPITQNNYMSDRIRWFNTDPSEVSKTRKAVYNRHSILLQALEDGSKLSLSTFIAVRNEDNRTSRDYFQISPVEDYISKMVLAHNDRILLPTMADKKTWYSISGVKLFHDMLSKSRSTERQTDTGIQVQYVDDQMYHYSDATLQTFADYFLDEFNAIEQYYADKSQVEQNPNLAIDNYHGKIKNGKMDNMGNGGYFRYFSSIRMRGEDGNYKYMPLNQMIYAWSKFDYDNNQNQMPTRLKQLKNTLFSNREVLFDMINATLQDKVQEELDFLVDKGIIKKYANGEYENLLIPSNMLDDYHERSRSLPNGDSSKRSKPAALYSLIANHVANQMVSIIEVEKAFVGDPAYYKWKRDKKQPWIIVERSVDKIKRLGSVLSTGDNLRTYWGDGDPRNNSKFTVLHMSDNEVGSVKFDEYKKMFTAAEVMKHIQRTNPNIDQKRLVNMVSKENINNTMKTLNAKVKKAIEDSVARQIAAYGIDENGRGRINQADAAVYIRPALYKRIVQAVGEWSPEVERAFDLLESPDESWLSDPKLYAQAIETLIKPLKMVYFGNHELTKLGLNVPVFDKMAIFPMFRVMAKADNYHLYNRMNNEELGAIDMLTFESAVKVGGRKKFKPYKDAQNSRFNLEDLNKPSTSIVNGETNFEGLDSDNSKLPTYIQDLRNLRLQMNTDPHEHTDRSLGTQFAKVALSNLVKSRPYGLNKGVEYTGRQIIDNVFNSINRLSDLGAQKIYDEFTDDGTLSTRKLSNFLIRQAKDSGLSRDVVSSFEIDESTGQMRVPLSAQSNRRFIESRIISQVGKRAIDINTPGGSAIQHAFFGFKNTTITDQEFVGRAFNDGKDLSPLNEDGSMDCMLSTNFFRHVVPASVRKQGYTAIREWLIEKNIIGQNAKPYALGYRIPTQGLSSTASLKVTDVLPESMGDVIVVPNDFTAMTGSDFDIDKLYIVTGYYDKDGNYLECNWDDIDSNSEQQLVNGLIDMYRIAISDDTNIDQTKAPLDNLTEKVKSNILPLVMGTAKNEAKPMYELLPSYQLFKKFEYTGGKDGIAPFALASTNHALTQALNLRMDLGEVADLYDLGNINDITSQDGERILDWLSAMINAHVDVAKDPYIINLNVNSVTYSMTEFLLRTGKGEATFYFLSQPILKDFANMIIKLNGQYGVDPQDVSYSQLIDDTLSGLKRQYMREFANFVDSQSDENVKKKLNQEWAGLLDFENSPDTPRRAVDVELLKKALTSNIEGNRDLNFYLQQVLVATAYQDMLPYAERLTKLVRLSQIDTKKYGNTLAQQANYSKSVFDFIRNDGELFYQTDDKGVKIEDENQNALLNYYSNSFLMKKLKNAVDIPRFILHQDFIQATDMYGGLFNNMINSMIGERSGINKQLAMKLDSIVDSVIRARIANSTPAMHLEQGELKEMVMGNRTVPKRLHQLKYAIYRNINGRYDNLLNGDGSISNAFLNYLIPTLATDSTEGGIDAMSLLNSSMANSSNFENRLIAYFSDLMSSEDAAVRQFANRLALYAYYTSYDNKAPNTFSHLISSQFRVDSGYADNIRQAIGDMNTGQWLGNVFNETIDEPTLSSYPSIALNIARNNAQDSEVVKNVVKPKSNRYNSKSFIYAPSPWTDGTGTYLMSFSTKPRKDERDFLSIDYPVYGKRNTVLYVKIGRLEVYDKEKGKKLGQAGQTIYAAVPRLGIQSGSNTVNEYYKDAYSLSDFDENNISVLSYKYLNDFFNDQSKYKMWVKGVDSKNIDISLIPSQYFNEQFNAHGLDRLTEDVDLSENSADNTISQEVNDEKPTQQSEKPKSKAMETKELDRDIAAEAGLLDKGNLMTKVNQQLLMTEAMMEAVPYEDPNAGVESSGEDISDMFTSEDDLNEDNFSDDAYNNCKGK